VLPAALLALVAGTAHAATPTYPALYAFGDSLSDSGNEYTISGDTKPISPPYARGRWSNGPTWVQDLASEFGLPSLQPSLTGGNNFAIAGACTGTTIAHQANTTDLPTQIANFTSAVPHPVVGALYTLDIGNNDVSAITGISGITPAEAQYAVTQAVANETTFIGQLFAAGMRTLLLLNVPDQRHQPVNSLATPAQLQAIGELDTSYNAQLLTSVQGLAAKDGFGVVMLDFFGMTDVLVSQGATYGFTNVTLPCWTGSPTAYNGTLCAPTLAGQDKYLFWDLVHPTARGHLLISEESLELLSTPEAGGTVAE